MSQRKAIADENTWRGRSRATRNRAPHDRGKPLLSVEEAAELLGQSRSSLYRAIATGTLPLPVLKIGGRYRIARAAVERLIDGQSQTQTS